MYLLSNLAVYYFNWYYGFQGPHSHILMTGRGGGSEWSGFHTVKQFLSLSVITMLPKILLMFNIDPNQYLLYHTTLLYLKVVGGGGAQTVPALISKIHIFATNTATATKLGDFS